MALPYDNFCPGERTLNHLVSDVDSKVKQYEAKFSELKSALQASGVIHTEITVLRILNVMNNLSVLFPLLCQSRLISFAKQPLKLISMTCPTQRVLSTMLIKDACQALGKKSLTRSAIG